MPDSEYTEVPLRKADGSIRAIALVDNDLADEIGQHRWHLVPSRGSGYAARATVIDGKRFLIYLHRQILGLVPGDGLVGDHINRNTLDNRRANLRVLSQSESLQNTSPRKNTTSQYRGVHFKDGRWMAVAQHKGVTYPLGAFGQEIQAAAAAARWRKDNMPASVEDPALLAFADT